MSAAGAAGTLPLTGADCFLRAFDHEIRRMNGASHVSQLVLRLGPGFDVSGFQGMVEAAARAHPLLRAPVARRLGLGAPVFRLAAAARCPMPRIEIHEAEAPADGEPPLPELFFARLNQPLSLRRGELLRFDLVRYAGGAAGADLAASWLHLLFDGAGSERFLRWLEECFQGQRPLAELPDPGEVAPVRSPKPSFGERGRAARAWQGWHDAMGARPPRSLAGPLRRTPQALRYTVSTFTADETARVVEAARRRAGFLTPMLFYLAAALRAHHAVFQARGVDPGSYVVPLPVNLRPKGGEGAVFRTHVSLIWFQAFPEQMDDFDGLVADLKAQRVAAIRAGQIENGVHAMDFARLAPRRLYAHMARKSLGGELCSFFFAYTDAFLPGLASFFGAGIRNGFHVPPVPPSPGSCLAISLREQRLNLTHVHQRGVLSERELAIFHERLRADLLG
ncbi:MAG TPA: hypothetical protein VII72_14965 [Myxococcota bacterium]|jgi:hypothetical protein